jgi:hypothetical protein
LAERKTYRTLNASTGSKQTHLHVLDTRDGKEVRLIHASMSLGDPGDWEEFENLKQIK